MGDERWAWVKHRDTLQIRQVPERQVAALGAGWDEISVDEAFEMRSRG